MWLEEVGGRKFIFALVLSGFFAGFVFVDKMTVSEFTTAVTWVYGLFVTANVVQKLPVRKKTV